MEGAKEDSEEIILSEIGARKRGGNCWGEKGFFLSAIEGMHHYSASGGQILQSENLLPETHAAHPSLQLTSLNGTPPL